MTIKNKNIGDKNRKISGKKIMLVTALLSGGVVIRVNNHINNSFGHAPKEVINFDLTLESTDVLIDDKGTFYVGEGTPIDNFNIYDFVTILDESGNVIADKDVTLEWDVKEYFEGTTFGTKGEYLITITATTADGRKGELEYKLVVKEGHVFEEIKEISDIPVDVNNTKDILDFQEHFRVLNSATGADTGAQIKSTLEDEDLQSVGTTQVIFYTELDGIKFTNSVNISVVDTIAPRIDLLDSFDKEGIKWNKDAQSITISDLDKTIGDFSFDTYATAYDASGDYELSWNFDEVMDGKLGEISSNEVTIKAVDGSGNESTVKIYVDISTVSIEFKEGISKVAFELFHTPDLNDPMNKVSAFYDVLDAAGNPVADDRISWDLTKEMLSTMGEYRLRVEVLDENKNELIGAKGVDVKVDDTTAPEIELVPGVNTSFNVEVDQFKSIDNLYMYLDGISNIDDLVTITDNSGSWGYRFEYNGQPLTDELLRTVGAKGITIYVFDYDNEGNELNHSRLSDANGQALAITLNIVDTKAATVIITDEIINLEVTRNATKEMIEINNYADISDNSGSFTWDLRVKGSQDDVMNYEEMLGKSTPLQGVDLELVVTDASGNKTYSNMLLIVTDTEPPIIEVRTSEETININPSASDMNRYRNIDSYVRVTDNSLGFNYTWDFDQVVNVTVADVYYVTVTATDDAGNVSEETITFTVEDTEVPSVIVNTRTITIEANEYLNKDELEFDIDLNNYITVTDNSKGLIDVTFDYSNVDFGEIGTYEVIISATDASDNEALNYIELKVIAGDPKVNVVRDQVIVDTIAIENSVFTGIKIEVKDGKILIERASSTDEDEVMSYLTMENLLDFLTISGETIESSIWDLSSLDVTTVGTNSIDVTVTNNFGKTVTKAIEFSVVYEYDSLIKVSGDNFINIEIDTNEGMGKDWFRTNYEVTDYVEYRASGGSGTILWRTLELDNVDFDTVGTYIVTASITDGHEDTDQVSLTLNIIDTTGPELTVTDPAVVEINELDANDFDISTYATATDNSGITPTLSWNLSTQVDFTKVGIYTVTIKAVDAEGNETFEDITLEVKDTKGPVLTPTPGMDIITVEINSRDSSSYSINSFVTATDNSGVAPELEWDIESVDFATVGTNTITIKAKDAAGNEAIEVTVEFIIVDTIAPTIDIDASGLEELKVEISTKTENDYSDWLEDYVTVTDNSGESITPSWDITGVDFNTFGTYMVTITAVDSSNNTTTQVVSFGVSDTTAPVITIKDDKEITTLEVFDGKLADFTLADFATCSDASTCTIEWDIQNVDFSTVGTYVVTIKAVDIYGNESRAEITIEVQDTAKPEIVITRPDILISMDKYTSSDFNVNDFATVTDNYDKSVSLTWDIDSSVSFDAEGIYYVTITAIDSSGNEAEEKTVEFKVEEINIILEEVSTFEIEVTQTPDAANIDVETYFNAKKDDGSAVDGITWNLTNDMLKVYGTHGVTLTIEFDGGKTVKMEVTLEVVDNTPPTVSIDTTTTTIELGDSSTFDNLKPEDFVTASDNSKDITYSWDFDNVVEQTIAGTYTVEITVTDVAGNETIVTTEIVVEDNVAPVLELNNDFDRNNMTWSKGTKELSILAGDKTPGEIDLWELVTATDLSTAGLTISWDLPDASLNTVEHYSAIISVSDGTNTTTETITVNVLRATPILNDFNVDKSYNEIIVDVDITNINQAISSLEIILQNKDGSEAGRYTQDLTTPLDALTINHVFNVNSNTEYKVVFEYTYATLKDNSDAKTITDTKDVKTLGYSQNDVLGTITDTYISHTGLIVNYEIGNDLGLLVSANLVLIDSANVETTHTIDVNDETGSHSFATLTPNNDYKIEIRLNYNFNDGNNEQTKISDSKDIRTLAYSEHDVVTDITGITQTPSTISADYNITDIYGLIIVNGIRAKIYDASTMTQVGADIVLTDLNGSVSFQGLNANTQYIVVIEAELDLRDGTNVIKETGTQTTTEAHSFDEITVNINNVMVDYNDITFDYEVFDPSSLLVSNTLQISINGQLYDLTSLNGTASLAGHKDIYSGTIYDVQIHFEYDLKDGKGSLVHDTNKYGFVETTRTYDIDKDLTLTSHNLGSDTSTIYVDYALRNLNFIGDMSTMSITITNGTITEEIFLSDYFSSQASIPLEGQIMLSSINGNALEVNTSYDVWIGIDYDLRDGQTGTQREKLLLETTEIKTQDQELSGYNVISTITRGYTFINTSFDVQNTTVHTDILDTFQIALLDINGNVVPGYDYVSQSVSIGTNDYKFENLKSDTEYTIVYRVENPNFTDGTNGHDKYIDIMRSVSTRTYDTNLINVEYDLTKGLTFLHLENINIVNGNEVFENIDYSNVVLTITYTTREGQVITVERNLGSLTEGEFAEELFTGIQSDRDVKIEFRLEHDLKDGNGVQSGDKELVRTFDEKTEAYDFTFEIVNDEVLVTGIRTGFNGTELMIYEEVEGYTVTDIKENAFYGSSISFTEVTIPRTVGTIGENAFRGVSLTTVNLTNVLEVIPTVITRATTNADAKLVIGNNAFRDNAITAFDFTTTETIGVSAFRVNDLSVVELGDNVTFVEQEAFVNAGVLSLTLGSLLSDEKFGTNSFVGNAINDLTIGHIGFKHNSLGYSKDVFDNNGYKLTLADTAVGTIAPQSWRYDLNRTEYSDVPIIDLEIGSGIEEIQLSAFLGNILNEVVIGENVHTIGNHVFDGTGMTKLTLGNSLESIGLCSFMDNNLTEVIFPETLEYIGPNAFENNQITELVIPSTVSQIEEEAFLNNNITKLSLGELLSDENFGLNTFVGNEIADLTVGNIGFKHSSLGYSGDVFDNNGYKLTLADTAVGTIKDQAWRYDPSRTEYSDVPIIDLIIGDGIEEIMLSAFYGNQLNEVVIGDSVHTISGHVFNSTGITKLTLGASIKTIHANAFNNNKIAELTFPETLEYIGANAFEGNLLTELVIPSTVTEIADEAFLNNDITKLSLGELLSDDNFGLNTFVGNEIVDLTVGHIGFKHSSLGYSGDVFNNNGYKLTLADTAVGTILQQAWRYDPTRTEYSDVPLIDLTIGNGIEEIQLSAFYGNQLNEVVIGDNVHTIGGHVFNSTGITKLTLGKSVKLIQAHAFDNNNITELSFPESLETIQNNAFEENDIVELSIPDSIKSLGKEAFLNNDITKLSLGTNISDATLDYDAFKGNSIADLTLSNPTVNQATFGDGTNVFNSAGIDLTYSSSAAGVIPANAWRYETGYSSIKVNNLKLSAGITEISDYAFYKNNLSDVELLSSLEKIGASTFRGNAFTVVVIPENMKSIGNYAFADNSITTFNFVSGVTHISEGLLDNNALTTLVLPNHIQTMGAYAFRDNNISNLTVSDNITEFKDGVFENNSLTSFVVEDYITSIGATAFKGNSITEIEIASSVNSVGDEAFADNDITKLTIADGISATIFGTDTFVSNNIDTLIVGSTDYKHNTFGASTDVFNTTTGLSLEFTDNATGEIVDSAWEYIPGSTTTSNVQLNGIKIGNSITAIGDKAFLGNILQTVVIGDGVLTVGEQSFASMGITSLTLGNSIQRVGTEAFLNNEIVSFVFPQTLTHIGVGAFKDNLIAELVLPNSVSYVGSNAFENNGMTKLSIGELLSDDKFGDNTFVGNSINDLTVGHIGFEHFSLGYSGDVFDNNGFKLTLADTAVGTILDQAWRYDTTDTKYSDVPLIALSIGSGVERIMLSAFYGNELEEVVIGENVHTIDGHAFNFNKITKVTFGSSLTTISANAFNNNNLTSVSFPASVTTINNTAFANNDLTEVTIPDTVTMLGDTVFQNNDITKVTLGSGLNASNIGVNVFDGNDINDLIINNSSFIYSSFGSVNSVFDTNGFNLTYGVGATGSIPSNAWRHGSSYCPISITDLNFNGSVTAIGNYAFESNVLGSVTLGEDIKTLGTYAFNNTSLTSVTLNDSLDTIGAYAFSNNSLTAVTLNDSLRVIGTAAFINNGIESVTFPNTVIEIGASSFKSNELNTVVFGTGLSAIPASAFEYNKLSTVDIPTGLNSIGNGAFRYNSLTEVTVPEDTSNIYGEAFAYNTLADGSKSLTKVTVGKNVTDSAFGTDTFKGSIINDLTVSHSSINHRSLGISDEIFDLNGINLTYTEDATGEIEAQAWRYDPGNSSYSEVQVIGLTLGTNIDIIGLSAFYANSLSEIVIPDGITNVESYAFFNAGATSLKLGKDLSRIGNYTFKGSNLTSVTFPASLTEIGAEAFIDNDITELVVSDNVGTIGNRAFQGNDITKLTLGKLLNNSTLGDDTFLNNSIDDLTIGHSDFGHSTLGNSKNVFNNSGFNLTIADTATGSIAAQGWRYGTTSSSQYSWVKIKDLVIGNGVQLLELSAFYGNILTNLSIGNSVHTIQGHVFREGQIVNLHIGSSMDKIQGYAFSENELLTEVVIPSSVTDLQANAFINCTNITKVIFMGGKVLNGSTAFPQSNPTFYAADGVTEIT